MAQSYLTPAHPGMPPLALGVCSWSLQVNEHPGAQRFLATLGINVVQIACGDPHHASWDEGDSMPAVAHRSGIIMTGAMLGFPGEDYTHATIDQGNRRIRRSLHFGRRGSSA